MAKNELLPFADGEDANVLPTNQWEALTDILENGFRSGIARSEQVNRVLAQGAVASYVLGQLIVDQLNKDATLDKSALYQNLILALQENAKDACLPLSGGNVTGNLTVQGKNIVRTVNGTSADASGNVTISGFESVTATGANYVRYASGLQICWGSVYLVSQQADATVAFPVAFGGTPNIVLGNTGTSACLEFVTSVSTTSCTIKATNTGEGLAYFDRDISYIAIGKWK